MNVFLRSVFISRITKRRLNKKTSSTSWVLWKKILNIWSSRDITLYGRINLVNTLALSKLTLVCSALITPVSFSNKVNKIISYYIWQYKKPKIKKFTIMKSKVEGGLKMTDFTTFDKALKLWWV